MAYDTLEKSAADGRPVDLYVFSRGSGFVWRYTTADREVSVESNVYTPEIIERGNIEQGPEPQRSNLRLTVPHTFPIAELYKIAPPSDPVRLVLRQFHYGDTDPATIWQGEIVDVDFQGDDAIIELSPISGGFDDMGLRRCFQKSCPFVLYGPDCTLDPAVYRLTTTLAAKTGLALTIPPASALADGYYDGGYIEWLVAPGTYERRFISSHVGSTITVDMAPLGLEVGAEVRVYPGCDHSIATCNSKFANALNYGGMPYIPTKNPYGADPVY